MGKTSLRWLISVAAVALVVTGILLVGRWTRERARLLDRSCIQFSDIDCDVPPGMTRRDFLTEVQYIAIRPDRVELLEEGLADQLASAFARHARVEKVDRVEVLPGRIRVQLTFRRARPPTMPGRS